MDAGDFLGTQSTYKVLFCVSFLSSSRKTFSTVVFWGLYHGLIFLPVILSYVGPAPYATAKPPPTGLPNGDCSRPTSEVMEIVLD